jgi:hypothetical protein
MLPNFVEMKSLWIYPSVITAGHVNFILVKRKCCAYTLVSPFSMGTTILLKFKVFEADLERSRWIKVNF